MGYTAEDENLIKEKWDDLLLSCTKICKNDEDWNFIKRAFFLAKEAHEGVRRRSGEPYLLHPIAVAKIVIEEIGLGVKSVVAALLHDVVEDTEYSVEDMERIFGPKIASMVDGLTKMSGVFNADTSEQAEYFRKVLLTLSDDVRGILIKIADRLHNMRTLGAMPMNKQIKITGETIYLFAPLAYRLGLYSIKSELEDLCMKYRFPQQYAEITQKLQESEASRREFINKFNAPIIASLNRDNINYEISGRVKSVYSIWSKMQRKQIPFEEVYDLFAIRIILDSALEKEKMECWQVYSIITDMYQPNPKRLRDWLSIPKSNGYESLHITVLGPENKWVEVQIRTERMDEIAERGLAAHWRYKGIKSGESGVDEWLNNIRSALENNDDLQLMDQFKMDLYEDEVFVFTPKGDLFKFPKGATVLDFAYTIHTNVGDHCIGAKINEKNAPLRQKLNSGDQVEILTANNQSPKQDWLNFVVTGKARAKIRQALKEMQAKQGAFAKELLERKFKNRKIEYDEPTMMHVIKKLGFKVGTDFYKSLADETTDVNEVLDLYTEQQKIEAGLAEHTPAPSAENYNIPSEAELKAKTNDDVLVIDQNLKGLDFSLAKCCQPIYGDDVFGFVTVNGGIKIHRQDCPNAQELRKRFGYRIVKARWAGKRGSQYPITLKVIGNDDLGIVNNITSIISKEEKISLRSISIDSHDGLFSGTLTVMLDDTSKLQLLEKKLKTIKGVKQVSRN